MIERRQKVHGLPLSSRVLSPALTCEQQLRIEDFVRLRRNTSCVDTAQRWFLSGNHRPSSPFQLRLPLLQPKPRLAVANVPKGPSLYTSSTSPLLDPAPGTCPPRAKLAPYSSSVEARFLRRPSGVWLPTRISYRSQAARGRELAYSAFCTMTRPAYCTMLI